MRNVAQETDNEHNTIIFRARNGSITRSLEGHHRHALRQTLRIVNDEQVLQRSDRLSKEVLRQLVLRDTYE
jgi:hypothetical protein